MYETTVRGTADILGPDRQLESELGLCTWVRRTKKLYTVIICTRPLVGHKQKERITRAQTESRRKPHANKKVNMSIIYKVYTTTLLASALHCL